MTTEIIGKIAAIDLQKKHLVVMDKDQILHPYTCAEPLDMILQKQKVGYFVKVTLDGDICKKIEYAPRPADWPFQKGQGKQYQPRNERLIVIQSCAKLAADVLLAPGITHLSYTRPQGVMGVTINEGGIDFDEAMDIIITRAIKDTDTIMKAGGEGK